MEKAHISLVPEDRRRSFAFETLVKDGITFAVGETSSSTAMKE